MNYYNEEDVVKIARKYFLMGMIAGGGCSLIGMLLGAISLS